MDVIQVIETISNIISNIIIGGIGLYLGYKTYKESFNKYVDIKARIVYAIGSNSYRDINIYLELYNDGNDIANDIVLKCKNKNIDKNNSIFNNNLGFLKPKETKTILCGVKLTTENILIFGLDDGDINSIFSNGIDICINYNDTYDIKHLDLSFLKNITTPYIRPENDLTDINKTLKEISEKLKN